MKNNSLFKYLLIFSNVFIFLNVLYPQRLPVSTFFIRDTSWKYLGRPRPGLNTLRFPPDSLLANNNWMWHGTPIFSPDLKEIFWSKYDRNINRGILVYIKYNNINWSSMQLAPFGNQNYFESSPAYSYNGDTLFFASWRPGGFLFRTCRTYSGWTTPEPLNISVPPGYSAGLDITVAKNGTVYYTLNDTINFNSDIYKSKLVNGQYQVPENLGSVINSDSSEVCPYIDPYERFIIFASKRAGGYGYHDLYISKRKPDSTWNIPVNLGSTINTSFEDAFPSVTPDSQYFFFTTAKSGDIGYNPYWISMQYIYNLISIVINNQNEIKKDFELYQNYPNPFNTSTKIKFNIPMKHVIARSEATWQSQVVSLKVFDILGKEIKTLVNESLAPGNYEVEWNANNFPSGIYFYRLEAGEYSNMKKLVLIK